MSDQKYDDDCDETWHATLAGEFDPEPDLGYHPGEDE
jgi:hypothetical protein